MISTATLDLPPVVDALVGVLAALLIVPYACRVRLLSIAEHRLAVCLLHIAGMVVVGLTALAVLSGARVDVTDIAAVVMSGCHILSTYYTWGGRAMPPDHVAKPAPVLAGILARVLGWRGGDERG